jgi:hypothetical protein
VLLDFVNLRTQELNELILGSYRSIVECERRLKC